MTIHAELTRAQAQAIQGRASVHQSLSRDDPVFPHLDHQYRSLQSLCEAQLHYVDKLQIHGNALIEGFAQVLNEARADTVHVLQGCAAEQASLPQIVAAVSPSQYRCLVGLNACLSLAARGALTLLNDLLDIERNERHSSTVSQVTKNSKRHEVNGYLMSAEDQLRNMAAGLGLDDPDTQSIMVLVVTLYVVVAVLKTKVKLVWNDDWTSGNWLRVCHDYTMWRMNNRDRTKVFYYGPRGHGNLQTLRALCEHCGYHADPKRAHKTMIGVDLEKVQRTFVHGEVVIMGDGGHSAYVNDRGLLDHMMMAKGTKLGKPLPYGLISYLDSLNIVDTAFYPHQPFVRHDFTLKTMFSLEGTKNQRGFFEVWTKRP